MGRHREPLDYRRRIGIKTDAKRDNQVDCCKDHRKKMETTLFTTSLRPRSQEPDERWKLNWDHWNKTGGRRSSRNAKESNKLTEGLTIAGEQFKVHFATISYNRHTHQTRGIVGMILDSEILQRSSIKLLASMKQTESQCDPPNLRDPPSLEQEPIKDQSA